VSPPADAFAGTLGDGSVTHGFAIPASTKQLVTATVADWDAVSTELRLWKRDGDHWTQIGESWRGVVGGNGTAWGSGLHGVGAPDGHQGPIKREGDGKSPAGVFDLTSAFGYASAPPKGTTFGYQQTSDAWKCVDDPASHEYNKILDARTTTVDWKSAEDMHRKDALYTWVVAVGHNEARTPHDGSCIFLHVWGGPASSTVGCTAMEEPRLARLIATLSPADHPAYVLLPRAEYDALAATWDLPRL
jgi:D-alanyl-D-alanine dipeptidase